MHNGRARDRSRSRGSGAGGDMERGARPVRTGRRALSAKLRGRGADGREGSGSASQSACIPRAHVRATTLLNRGAAAEMRAGRQKKKERETGREAERGGGKVAKEKREQRAKGQSAQGIARGERNVQRETAEERMDKTRPPRSLGSGKKEQRPDCPLIS